MKTLQTLARAAVKINGQEWFRPSLRDEALQTASELAVLDDRLSLLPGQPGCIDGKLEKAAAMFGLDPMVFSHILVSGVNQLLDPTDNFHFEVLATRSSSKTRLRNQKKGGR